MSAILAEGDARVETAAEPRPRMRALRERRTAASSNMGVGSGVRPDAEAAAMDPGVRIRPGDGAMTAPTRAVCPLIVYSPQVFHELLELRGRETVEVLLLVTGRLAPEHGGGRLSLGRQLQLVATAIHLGAYAFEPAGCFRLVEQGDQAGLVDVQGARQLPLGSARVRRNELQQGRETGAHRPVRDVAQEAAPELHHGEAYVKPEQLVERPRVDVPALVRRSNSFLLPGLPARGRCGFARCRHDSTPGSRRNDEVRAGIRQTFSIH